MRDFLPADVRKREYVIGIIKEVYESYGFEPLETPCRRKPRHADGQIRRRGNQLIFKILNAGSIATNLRPCRSKSDSYTL
jgi:histidyl-tRNA synthetase